MLDRLRYVFIFGQITQVAIFHQKKTIIQLYNITPKGLRLNFPVRSYEANRIKQRAEHALLNERIRNAVRTRRQLTTNSQRLREEILEQVDEEGYEVIMELVDHCRKKIFEDTKTIQQEKFRRLQEASNRSTLTTNGGLNAEKTVRNLSKRPLSPEETSVLALGLNFSVTPRSLPVVDVITVLEDTATQLPQKEAEEFRVQTKRCIEKSKVPKSNLNRDMRSALKNLRQDDSIVILPADKGNVTVVMNKDDYKEKMHEVLQEGEYRKVSADPTARVEKSVNDELTRLFQSGEINKIVYDQLRTTHSVIPQLYGLPKIHKENTPLRPIVSCIGSPTYKVAKSLTRIISTLTGRTSSFVRDSGDFVQKIQNFQMSSDDRLVSFDVKSLFTKVPIEEALEVIGQKLEIM